VGLGGEEKAEDSNLGKNTSIFASFKRSLLIVGTDRSLSLVPE